MSEVPRKLLATLMIHGAQSPDKAMSSEDLARQFGTDPTRIERDIKSLGEGGYLVSFEQNGVRLVYLTMTGILAASSAYS
jgi:biotin operon repressor